ncbi:MAG TPA: VOC family protein [Gemmatimonadales bacterium]|nr:VOC family protein [Gemmatimonadales bacterium]
MSHPVTAGWYTPMLHVSSIEQSIPFYERLGFELIDTDRCEPIGWARMHCQGGALMFLRSERPPEPVEQATLFVMYTPDLPAFRTRLLEAGAAISDIEYPDHGPSGEAYLADPDGYRLCIVHWSDKEHQEWLKRIGRESV